MKFLFWKQEEKSETKPVEKLLALLVDKLEEKPIEISKMTEEEKRKAACALNLCTVSVSQIIDYNDLIVLEQEYDCILNNLNLEHMPKDQALLNILKQILDTITFFRIQEGDKVIAEKKYQQKVKNAIWNALPNFGVISVGDPYSFVAALALSAGMGYMNYRREKAKMSLEQEEDRWKLQRTAIEQFNGLRRELFDTAWRLAEKYEFHDNLRLTEKQISQFNAILMDTNKLRKYLRLKSNENHFEAYPPYLYHLANAAYELANYVDDDSKELYINEAEQYYKKYHEADFKLLREDYIRTQSSLEYVDILYQKYGLEKKDLIIELLSEIEKSACNTYDALQICAMDYLKIGNWNDATRVLVKLVSEKYNADTNAKLLSNIYLIQTKEDFSLFESNKKLFKELIGIAPNNINLFQMPQSLDNFEVAWNDSYNSFLSVQQSILKTNIERFFSELLNKKVEEFYKIVYSTPGEDSNQMGVNFFEDTPIGQRTRKMFFESYFSQKENAEYYFSELRRKDVFSAYDLFINEFCGDLNSTLAHIPDYNNNPKKGFEKFKKGVKSNWNDDSYIKNWYNFLTIKDDLTRARNLFGIILDLSPRMDIEYVIKLALEIFYSWISEDVTFDKLVQYEAYLIHECERHQMFGIFETAPAIRPSKYLQEKYFDVKHYLGIQEDTTDNRKKIEQIKQCLKKAETQLQSDDSFRYSCDENGIREIMLEHQKKDEIIKINDSGKETLGALYDKGGTFDKWSCIVFTNDGMYITRDKIMGIRDFFFYHKSNYRELRRKDNTIFYMKDNAESVIYKGSKINAILDLINAIIYFN